MFTECPECRTVFRLNASVLKQAHGQVRCGGCGHTFNALDHLLEELPEDDAGNTQTAQIFEQRSEALLRSLDELAGPDDIRIEDTGVEWRVLDPDDDESPAAEPAPASRPEAGNPQRPLDFDVGTADAEEMRFDDNTPLPDEFYRPVEESVPQRRAEDHAAPPPDDEFQVTLEFGEGQDWQELLAEVEADREDAVAAAGDETRSPSVPTLHAAGDPASQPSGASEGNQPQVAAAKQTPATPLAAEDFDGGAFGESIVMEGDTINDLDLETAADAGSAGELPYPDDPAAAQTADGKPAGRRRRYPGIAAITVLGLLLAAQLLHANRAALATYEVFDRTLAPLYRAIGQPVTPAWDVRGWQFQATSGSTDATGERLTIESRIANRSAAPLPYPLVHVSLTDRWEGVIGSRILRPADYLRSAAAGGHTVASGNAFTAVIHIDAPAPDATGFKLNVCYRQGPDRLRCAVDDFKD